MDSIEVSSMEGLGLLGYAACIAVGVGNLVGVVLVALQLPGTWLILLLTGLLAFFQWELGTIGWPPLICLLGLAVVGEGLEFAAGSMGSRKAGGTKRGAWGALFGSIPGAIAGTIFLPVPIVGTVVGACLGAAGGSILGDRSGGVGWKPALKAGGGAAAGTFFGTVAKVFVALAMWAVSVGAMIF